MVDVDDSMPASIDDSIKTEYVASTQDSGKGQTISKWDKYKTVINRNRRIKYKLDPEYEKSRSYENYHDNPSPSKQRSFEAYHADPSPVKRCVFEAYHEHPSPVKRRILESYHAHPSPVKRRALESYHAHPSPVKRRALESYYKAHESSKKRLIEKHKFLRQNLIDRRSLQKLVASTITKKYTKLNSSVRTRTIGYIYKLIRNASKCKLPLKHVEAEHLVRSSICYRDVHCKQFVTSFKKLRTTIIATLVKVLELTKDETHEALLGASMHTANTESYFPESFYHSAALDTHGEVILTRKFQNNGHCCDLPKNAKCFLK